jgi:hypothetical protein
MFGVCIPVEKMGAVNSGDAGISEALIGVCCWIDLAFLRGYR